MDKPKDETIAVAGVTGQLGRRVAHYLVNEGAPVVALVRGADQAEQIAKILPACTVRTVDFNSVDSLSEALRGAKCVVSTVNGLAPVIIDAQSRLAEAAIRAGVQRFIPSDFSVDYLGLSRDGTNRNLDLRRAFCTHVHTLPLRVTSVLNGAFLDMLTGQMPIIIFGLRRVLCVGDPDQKFDFTSVDDTARFTARAALDDSAPRWLRIAGDQISPRELSKVMTELTGHSHGLLRPMGLTAFERLISVMKAVSPRTDALYPAWQGMQYLRDMASGAVSMAKLDNDRYGCAQMRTAKELLGDFLSGREAAIRFS